MDSIVSLPQQIVDWLSEQEDMSDIKFFVEYPPVNKAVPLRRTIVAVGIENIEIVDKFVANDDGVLERQEYCRLAKIKANLSICVPFSMGGQTCHDIFTRIANALTFRTNLNIAESGCVEIKSDRDTDALVMTGWFMMEADFCPAQSTDENFASFLDKELLCGSHIRNDEIHVTAEDKVKWNEAFVTGMYLGTGASSRSVSLDFMPSLVLISASGYPAVVTDFANSVTKNYFGMATIDTTTGITITATGFRASNKTISDSEYALNEAGLTYSYIAFK
ncbi:MAG: hypothetical protein IJ447_05600 [Clostridia bacterium]|nr:hypothetical protein [Clostridia bacterium]